MRDVRSRDLADVEAVPRLAKLLLEHIDVASLQIKRRRVAQRVHVSAGATEQHRLLGVAQGLARGEHQTFSLSNVVLGRARIKNHLPELRPCPAWQDLLILDDGPRLQKRGAKSGIWLAVIHGFGADLARRRNLRPVAGLCPRDTFVGRAHARALRVELRVVVIGLDESGFERLGMRERVRRNEHGRGGQCGRQASEKLHFDLELRAHPEPPGVSSPCKSI